MPSAPFDKQEWALEFLKKLGNAKAQATSDKTGGGDTGLTKVIKFVVAWENAESGGGLTIGCNHNPLNTCWVTPDSTPCNPGSGCVQEYSAGNDFGYSEGLNATVGALTDGMYASLLNALINTDTGNLGLDTQPMSVNIAGDLSVWSTGKRSPLNMTYVNNIVTLAHGNPPTGADIGQVTPNPGLPGISLSLDWLRIAKGALGMIMLLAGMSLLLKELTPAPVAGAVKRFLP